VAVLKEVRGRLCSRRCTALEFRFYNVALCAGAADGTCRIFQRKLKLSSVCFLRHRDLILCSEKYPDMVKWGVFSQNGSYTAKESKEKKELIKL
jgi:hypothetical protein